MAQGSLTVFEEFRKYIGDGSHNLVSDSFKIALITTIPTASDATPDFADYIDVSGTGYTAGGESSAVTYTEVGGVATFNAADVSWTQNGAGPTNIKAALLYNTTHAIGHDAVAFIDMTVDAGTTPVSLVDGNISITINASGIFTLT
jgi:hypothetical protein